MLPPLFYKQARKNLFIFIRLFPWLSSEFENFGMKTFADKVIAFNKQIDFKGNLPEGISIMNPFRENKNIISLCGAFYKKYYQDNHSPVFDIRD
jgi:hypothetical protein